MNQQQVQATIDASMQKALSTHNEIMETIKVQFGEKMYHVALAVAAAERAWISTIVNCCEMSAALQKATDMPAAVGETMLNHHAGQMNSTMMAVVVAAGLLAGLDNEKIEGLAKLLVQIRNEFTRRITEAHTQVHKAIGDAQGDSDGDDGSDLGKWTPPPGWLPN